MVSEDENTLTAKPGIRSAEEYQSVFVGIDIGGTNTKIGWVDSLGRCIQYDTFPTRADRPFQIFFKDLKTRLNNALEKYANIHEFSGIGIGAPIANRWTGTMEVASNFSWGKVPVVEMMRENFDVPVVIDNDANAAAMGEKCFGSAQRIKNFIMITLGTGLGSGFVVDDRLLYGAHGFAGELGHMIVDWNGRQCGCGRKGCLETYVSASGIKRTVFELLAEKMDRSNLRSIDFESLQAEQITAAADGISVGNRCFRVQVQAHFGRGHHPGLLSILEENSTLGGVGDVLAQASCRLGWCLRAHIQTGDGYARENLAGVSEFEADQTSACHQKEKEDTHEQRKKQLVCC